MWDIGKEATVFPERLHCAKEASQMECLALARTIWNPQSGGPRGHRELEIRSPPAPKSIVSLIHLPVAWLHDHRSHAKFRNQTLCPSPARIRLHLPALAQSRSAPLVIISLDGMRPDYVTHADEHGLKIPTLRSFIAKGTYAEGVTGVVPTVTYPSRTTLVTGVWPASTQDLRQHHLRSSACTPQRLVLVLQRHQSRNPLPGR